HRPINDRDSGCLCGVESTCLDQPAQSLVRARDLGQSAALGVGPPPEAQLHHPEQGAAAELRAVLLPRGRGAAILSALSDQLDAPILSRTSASGPRERRGRRGDGAGRCACPARRGRFHLRHHPARHAR
ncbi:hypothetical protein KXW38_002255, partial [Aspergillus fumigatus]